MIDYSNMPQNQILCVDMKSFYASCSAIMLGFDPLECYLAVVGNTDRSGSVVLAASPRLKKEFGIKTIWALSLPGKVAPISSAEYIKKTLFSILEEEGVKL